MTERLSARALGAELSPHPWQGEPAWLQRPDSLPLVAGLLTDGQLGFATPDGALLGPTVPLPGQLQHILGAQGGVLWLI